MYPYLPWHLQIYTINFIGVFVNETDTTNKIGVIIFGGEGLNYEVTSSEGANELALYILCRFQEPNRPFLEDLWALSVTSDNFSWQPINSVGDYPNNKLVYINSTEHFAVC